MEGKKIGEGEGEEIENEREKIRKIERKTTNRERRQNKKKTKTKKNQTRRTRESRREPKEVVRPRRRMWPKPQDLRFVSMHVSVHICISKHRRMYTDITGIASSRFGTR